MGFSFLCACVRVCVCASICLSVPSVGLSISLCECYVHLEVVRALSFMVFVRMGDIRLWLCHRQSIHRKRLNISLSVLVSQAYFIFVVVATFCMLDRLWPTNRYWIKRKFTTYISTFIAERGQDERKKRFVWHWDGCIDLYTCIWFCFYFICFRSLYFFLLLFKQ